jgi:HSP20 family molecular chaperone IbpA
MKARESFDLHAEVRRDKIESTFTDGVPGIRMPESPEAISREVKIRVE